MTHCPFLCRAYPHCSRAQPTPADTRVSGTKPSLSKWSTVCGDARLTTALRDRLPHQGLIVETGSESMRFRHSAAALPVVHAGPPKKSEDNVA